MNFILNNETISAGANPSLTVLDYLRLTKKLTGTKEGCREGDCGACTVIIGSIEKNKLKYKSVNSCLMPLSDLAGKHLVTIEGINNSGLNIIQQNMVDEGGTQCGFCTPGFIISITNYFINNSKYDLQNAVDSLDGNICRCTGYEGIKRAVSRVIDDLEKIKTNKKTGMNFLIHAGILPGYFLSIFKRLKELNKQTGSEKILLKKNKAGYLVSGGTDLYVQKWETLYNSKNYFISGKEELKQIKKTGNKIIIGGAVTVEEFGTSKIILKHFPQLNGFIKSFGSLPIRNRATIAGNIVNASPIADITNILMALNSGLILSGGKKKRSVPLNKFFISYKKTNLKPGEYIQAVVVEIPKDKFYFNYEKVSRRKYLDIASVNSSLFIELKNNKIKSAKLSAGGVAPVPLYLEKTSSFLKGYEINTGIILKSREIAQTEISPISDARGSKKYKSILLGQMIIAHFIKLFPGLIDEGRVL